MGDFLFNVYLFGIRWRLFVCRAKNTQLASKGT
jgi:hypothetical protein